MPLAPKRYFPLESFTRSNFSGQVHVFNACFTPECTSFGSGFDSISDTVGFLRSCFLRLARRLFWSGFPERAGFNRVLIEIELSEFVVFSIEIPIFDWNSDFSNSDFSNVCSEIVDSRHSNGYLCNVISCQGLSMCAQ